jgi:hypothetical protein
MVPGGTLVVCPTSLLHQWGRELRHKVHPAAGCEVHIYHAKVRFITDHDYLFVSWVLPLALCCVCSLSRQVGPERLLAGWTKYAWLYMPVSGDVLCVMLV